MNEHEENAFRFCERLSYKMKLEERSAKFFFDSFKFVAAKNKFIKTKEAKIRGEALKEEKNKMVDALYKKIKSKKKFRQEYQFFRNDFDRYNITDFIKLKLDGLMANISEMLTKTTRMKTKLKQLKLDRTKLNTELEEQTAKYQEYQATIKRLLANKYDKSTDVQGTHSRRESMLFNETVLDNFEDITLGDCNSELKELIMENWK